MLDGDQYSPLMGRGAGVAFDKSGSSPQNAYIDMSCNDFSSFIKFYVLIIDVLRQLYKLYCLVI